LVLAKDRVGLGIRELAERPVTLSHESGGRWRDGESRPLFGVSAL